MKNKCLRISAIALCHILWVTGWALAQTPSDIDAKRTLLPVDVAGYLDFRQLASDDLSVTRPFREYAASVFLSKTIGRWLFHSEINGNTAPEWDSEGLHLFPRSTNLSVKLETASVNYNWRDWLQGQAGFLFVPTYWRMHRYQSVVLSVDDPLIDQSIFPTAFKGGMVHGDKYFEEGGFSYHLYGGVSQEAKFHDAVPGDDLRRARSVGGKFVWHVPTRHFCDTFDIGVHQLTAHFTTGRLSRTDFHGAELNVARGPIRVLAEFAASSNRVQPGQTSSPRQGYYLQSSYRFSPTLFGVAEYDRLTRGSRVDDQFRLARLSMGLTYRPVSPLSLKFEVDRRVPLRSSLPAYHGVEAAIVYFFHTP